MSYSTKTSALVPGESEFIGNNKMYRNKMKNAF
jgi:hypothetical protein